MLRGLFAKRAGLPDKDREATDRVRTHAAGMLADSGAEITVSEIICLDPSCPGTETVMLIMSAGAKTRAAKVTKAATDVTEEDVRAALREAGFEVRG